MTKAPDIMWVFPRKDWFNAGASTHKIQCTGGKDVEYVSRSHCDALVAKARDDALRKAIASIRAAAYPEDGTYGPDQLHIQEAERATVEVSIEAILALIPETSHD